MCPTKLGHRVWTDACGTIVVPLTDSSESGVRNRTLLHDFDEIGRASCRERV